MVWCTWPRSMRDNTFSLASGGISSWGHRVSPFNLVTKWFSAIAGAHRPLAIAELVYCSLGVVVVGFDLVLSLQRRRVRTTVANKLRARPEQFSCGSISVYSLISMYNMSFNVPRGVCKYGWNQGFSFLSNTFTSDLLASGSCLASLRTKIVFSRSLCLPWAVLHHHLLFWPLQWTLLVLGQSKATSPKWRLTRSWS